MSEDDTCKETALEINRWLADLPSTMSELFKDDTWHAFEEELLAGRSFPLQRLEREICWYLQSFLKRRNETSINGYVMSIAQKLKGRDLYISNDRIPLSVQFVFPMSCFIVELFRKYSNEGLRNQDDYIFNKAENLHLLRHSLISLDDQFPLFLLVEFFNMTKIESEAPDNFVDLALHFFENMVGHTLKPPPTHDKIPIDEIKHLLDLVHYSLCPPFAERLIPPTTKTEMECEFINYTSELEEFGVKFKVIKGVNVSLLNITFKNGEMKIPSVKVAKSTLDLLKSLIQYEKKFPTTRRRYVSDYIKFILCLINSSKDAEILRCNGILENWIGSDKVIYNKLHELGVGIDISRNFTYSVVMKEVNQHCRRRRNLWMAKLWRNYFNSPWSLVSFIAAVVLLLLTITQTVYSILSYHYK